MLLGTAANAALVTNGTFDTDLSGWTLTGANLASWTGGFGNPPGSYRNPNVGSQVATLSQDISTSGGAAYQIQFDFADFNSGDDAFRVTFDGQTVVNGVLSPGSGTFSTYVFSGIVATDSTSTLAFSGFDNPSFWYVDNVIVTQVTQGAVPEPGSLALWGLGALGFAFAGYRRRKSA